MKTVTNMAAQGDLILTRVSALPKEAIERKRTGDLVLAHSETGHHHLIKDPLAKMFETTNPMICYLRMETPFVDLEHARPFDTHDTLRLLGEPNGESVWCVQRQREYTPEGWRRVED
jgi:hypothetical protein